MIKAWRDSLRVIALGLVAALAIGLAAAFLSQGSQGYLLTHFREREPAFLVDALDRVRHNYYGGMSSLGDWPPFFFSRDGRAYLPPAALREIRELPPLMTWIGDETIIVQMTSPQYSVVLTSAGTLYGGFTKNCLLFEELRRKQVLCAYDLLDGALFGLRYLNDLMGEPGLVRFFSKHNVDALIAGPRTYSDTKALLASSPALRECLETRIDVDEVLVLLRRPCRYGEQPKAAGGA